VDFEIPKMSNKYDEPDVRAEQFELAELCVGVAVQFIGRGYDDGEEALADFAVRAIQQSLGGKTVSNEQIDGFEELLRMLATADISSSGDFIADFVTKMCDSPEALRSNSRKLSMYNVLTAAACDLFAKTDDQEYEEFFDLLERAEFHLLCFRNPDKFRRAIVHAFQKSGFSHFSELAEAIRRKETEFVIRRLRRKLGLIGKRTATSVPEMSEEEAQFYR
jgi:hypothetical protein